MWPADSTCRLSDVVIYAVAKKEKEKEKEKKKKKTFPYKLNVSWHHS
jgi:hypothetical protein